MSFQEACKTLKETLPYEKAGATLLLEADGSQRIQVEEEASAMESVCRTRGALEIFRAQSEAESGRYWRIRKRVPWSLKALSNHHSLEDIAVPINAIQEIIWKIQELERSYNLQIPVFGHAGDGNLQAHPLKNPQSSEEDWYALLPRVLADLYKAAADLGGTISGEHGIGNKRKDFLPLVMGPDHKKSFGSGRHSQSR